MDRNEEMIAALRRERAMYAAQGKADRVGQVDEQLAHYGAEPEPDTAGVGPAGRQGPAAQQTTADAGATPPAKPTRTAKSNP